MIRWSILFLTLLCAMPATAQDNPLLQRLEAFAAAYNVGDAEAVASFYTEDGALLPPGQETLVGRAAIVPHYRQAFAAGVGGLQVHVREIRAHGPDAAVVIGDTRIDTRQGAIRARFLHVWRLTDAGWQLSRDIYNVIGPG